MKRLKLLAIALTALLWQDVTQASDGAADGPIGVRKVDGRIPADGSAERLRAAARRAGSIRVIVSLDDGLRVDPRQAADARTGRERMLAAAQDQVVARVHGRAQKRTKVARLGVAPILIMSVTEAELDRLLAEPRVEPVMRDTTFPASPARRVDPVAPMPLSELTKLIGAKKLWEEGFTGAGWIVAVLDSGVDALHPALRGKVRDEACFSPGDPASGHSSFCPNGEDFQIGKGSAPPCPSIYGMCLHGTHVSSIAVGDFQNNRGVAYDA